MSTTNEHEPEVPREFESLKSNSGFQVPDGYFENLHERVSELAEERPRMIRLNTTVRSIALGATAAAAAVMLFLFWPAQPAELNFTDAEVLAALDEPGMGLSGEDLLLEELTDEELDALLYEDEIPEEEMLEYLLQDEAEMELILEQL